MLELKEIRKGYKIGKNTQEVLKGISIKFGRQDFVSILGTSGSGKTTLLNVIGGLDKYDGGDLLIDGASTKGYKDKDWDVYRNHRVGFIFQNYNLISHQTVLSNVELSLTISGDTSADRRKKAIEALEKVGLGDHINKKPNQLSGGQMQRVAIARALVNDPDIILADEPTGALDSNTSIQVMDILKEVAKDKLVVMVTHNRELANEYSTRIIELKDGLVISDSKPFNEDIPVVEKKMKKNNMSFATTLRLSFNNLLTKKGRTFLVAIAGSIGVIGIALILALSSGLNKNISGLGEKVAVDYPISIGRTTFDMSGMHGENGAIVAKEKASDDGKLHSKDDLSSDASGVKITRNNLTELKKYIDRTDKFKKYTSKIQYEYELELQVYTKDYKKVNPSGYVSDNMLAFEDQDDDNIFKELGNKKDDYKVLAGAMPKNYNEVVLVVGENNKIEDSTLYSLGIKNPEDKTKDTTYEYNDILGKTYKVILNTDYYTKQGNLYRHNFADKTYMKNKVDNGIDIKIVGIVKNEDVGKCFVGYQHELILKVVEEINKTDLYKDQMSNRNVNILTGETFDGKDFEMDRHQKLLGTYEISNPSSISLYPKDFDAQKDITKLLDEYNDMNTKNSKEDLVVKYDNTLNNVFDDLHKGVDTVSIVLLSLVSTSSMVMTIMVTILTYVSVLERTKEIGILRAIGASRKDIRRVFISETVVEGFLAGVIGVFVTYLLSIPINKIVESKLGIANIASLSIKNALLLILGSVIINVMAGMLPSRKAAKKDAVSSLKTE